MEPDQSPSHGHTSLVHAARYHVAVVAVCLALGTVAGYLYGASMPSTYTSTARVLVNPSAGYPFAPPPASVRQDQQTSLETEAQVARSEEVLGIVTRQIPALTVARLQKAVQVSVPANTQVLEISYTAADGAIARQVADAVATAFLTNRQLRFESVNTARIDRLETQTLRVVDDLRAATAAAQVGSSSKRAFNEQLADALRNELVSLRAQRSSLENNESPAGAVISPATAGASSGALAALLMPVGGAFAGLALGCLVALLLERMNGRVRSASEVLAAGLPVLASVRHSGRRPHVFTRSRTNDFDNTIRRLRAHVLRLDPRPDVISVAPSGDGRSDSLVPDSLAASFARAGHRVVLVRTDGHAVAGNLAIEVDGLAEALLHERLSVLDLLQPSVEPLLSLLPPGRVTAQTRELIDADRLRAVLAPLVEVGHIVVIDSPGAGGVEGEAVVGAADLGLIVVTAGRSRLKDLEPTTAQPARRGSILAGVVIGRRSRLHRAMSGTGFGRLHQGDGGIDDQILAHGASQEQSASAAR